MISKFLVCALVVTVPFVANSQCSLTTKDGLYQATCFSKLTQGKSLLSFTEVAVAKDGNKGFLVLKILSNSAPTFQFRRNILIYLESGKVITLLNKNQHWKVNGELFGLFNLTESEISFLKNSNIHAVRFWACHEYEDCTEASEYYNEDAVNELFGTKTVKVNFPALISALFKA